jgi:hypothetical protein
MKFHLDEQNLALSLAQRTHVELVENAQKTKFVPRRNQAEITTCALSYYLQMDNMYSGCEHRVYMTTPAPALIQHGAAIAVHSLKPPLIHWRDQVYRESRNLPRLHCRRSSPFGAATGHPVRRPEISAVHCSTAGLHSSEEFEAVKRFADNPSFDCRDPRNSGPPPEEHGCRQLVHLNYELNRHSDLHIPSVVWLRPYVTQAWQHWKNPSDPTYARRTGTWSPGARVAE